MRQQPRCGVLRVGGLVVATVACSWPPVAAAHGLQASVGSAASAPSGSISIAGVTISGADPSSPQFKAAMQACRKLLPGGGPPTLTPAQQAIVANALRVGKARHAVLPASDLESRATDPVRMSAAARSYMS